MNNLSYVCILGVLLTGCSQQVAIVDGDCIPIQNGVVYHGEEGIDLFAPWGPIYTNHEGIVTLPSSACDISIRKEGYKSIFIESLPSKVTKVFLYAVSEPYESGLIDFKNCNEKE
ncbi:MAG: hypothetical protein ACYSUT_07860 [Planctomycetota bacterium]|jgi:hypothetical protein